MMRDAWPWSDLDRPRGPWALFLRSAEFLTTAFLWGYALVLIWPGQTLAAFPAFRWLDALSHGDDTFWAVAAFTLSILAPVAVWLDDGRLRLLSLLSQGVFYVFLGMSAFINSRLGFGWVTFLFSGGWLLWRTVDLALPRLKASIEQLRQHVAR